MLSPVARRSLGRAAVEHAQLSLLATGTDGENGEGRNLVLRMALAQPIQCSFALPGGEQDVIDALHSDETGPLPSALRGVPDGD